MTFGNCVIKNIKIKVSTRASEVSEKNVKERESNIPSYRFHANKNGAF